MALLRKKLSASQQALISLQEVLTHPPSILVRDSSIQRFEYTLDLFWKTLKEALASWEGKIVLFPKEAMRAWGIAVSLTTTEIELLLTMVEDRNRTSHMYDETLVEEIYSKIPTYAVVIETELQRLEERLREEGH